MTNTPEEIMMDLDLEYMKKYIPGTDHIVKLTGFVTERFNIYECVFFRHGNPKIIWVDMEMKLLYSGCFKDLCQKDSKYRPYSPAAKELKMKLFLATVEKKESYESKSLLKRDKQTMKNASSLRVNAAEFVPWALPIQNEIDSEIDPYGFSQEFYS